MILFIETHTGKLKNQYIVTPLLTANKRKIIHRILETKCIYMKIHLVYKYINIYLKELQNHQLLQNLKLFLIIFYS